MIQPHRYHYSLASAAGQQPKRQAATPGHQFPWCISSDVITTLLFAPCCAGKLQLCWCSVREPYYWSECGHRGQSYLWGFSKDCLIAKTPPSTLKDSDWLAWLRDWLTTDANCQRLGVWHEWGSVSVPAVKEIPAASTLLLGQRELVSCAGLSTISVFIPLSFLFLAFIVTCCLFM